MSISTAERIVDFIYDHTPATEKIEIGFFGGEPLIEFDLIRKITDLIRDHPSHDPARVCLTVVSNGTIFTREIADFFHAYGIAFGISCDGPPDIQDRYRRFHSGRRTAHVVEETIRQAVDAMPATMVNAVYGPKTLAHLSRTVRYLSSLGVRQIYLNPDFTASWTETEIDILPGVYGALGGLYVDYYRDDNPHFISPIDSKICVILRNGYHPLERCRMGRGELAFTPEGNIYPCERLVGDGMNGHRIGSVDEGIRPGSMLCHQAAGTELNPECLDCSLRDCCMNWCGCSNYFSSGYYNRVSAFLCASERALITAALDALEILDRQGETGRFFDHLSGLPRGNALSTLHDIHPQRTLRDSGSSAVESG